MAAIMKGKLLYLQIAKPAKPLHLVCCLSLRSFIINAHRLLSNKQANYFAASKGKITQPHYITIKMVATPIVTLYQKIGQKSINFPF